jgi:hypothetical protein
VGKRNDMDPLARRLFQASTALLLVLGLLNAVHVGSKTLSIILGSLVVTFGGVAVLRNQRVQKAKILRHRATR